MTSSFPRWLNNLRANLLGTRRNRPRAAPRPARAPRLAVEHLEDRAVPATHIWDDGGVTGNWSEAAEWNAAGVPTTGEAGGTVVAFPTSDPSTNQNIVGLVIDRIDFTSTGNTVTLATPLGLSGTVTANQLTNTGANTITGSSINLTGSTSFLEVASGTVTIASQFTGTSGFRKLGAGTLTLTTAVGNTYTGATTIADGVLLLNTNTTDDGLSDTITVGDGIGAAGSAVLRLMNDFEILDTATVTLNSDGRLDVLAGTSEDVTTLAVNGGRVTIAATGVFEIQPGGTVSSNGAAGSQITGAGNFRLQGGGSVTFNIANGAAASDLTVSAPINQAGVAGLTKTGAGTLTLSGTNTYTGTTTINAGTLQVNGTQTGSAVSLTAGTLGGSGTIGTVTTTGGAIQPGLGTTTSTLNTGNLTLAGATFAPGLLGTASDRLNVTGTVDLTGAVLNVAPIGASVVTATPFTLISNDGTDAVVGTFAGLPQGAIVTVGGQSFVLSYTGGDGNDVTLTLPFYSNAQIFGTFLVLQGAGVPGGFQVLQVPVDSQAIFADLTGDGYGDVILFLPTLALAVDGATGRFVVLSADLDGDNVRDLQVFNLDGTTTTTNGRTGIVTTM